MTASSSRITQTQEALAAERLDALICRLPEHLVMLAGYWPVIGRSALLLPASDAPVLFAPAMERDALRRAFVSEIRTFPVWKLGDPLPDAGLGKLLKDAVSSMGLRGKRVGFEGSGDEDLSPTQKVTEPWRPAAPTSAMLTDLGCQLVDVMPVLRRLRATKTNEDLERLRIANQIAGFGLRAFQEAVAEGRTEAEVAAAVEQAILSRGTGYEGTVHARGEALVFAGTERLSGVGWGYAPSTSRRLRAGDLVMLELSTVADGYFSDLTRMATVGRPSSRQQEVLDAVRRAQRSAIEAIRPGVTGNAVDSVARGILESAGLGDQFIHITGHGLGFRYHEPMPLLYPGSKDVLQVGMVTSVEPGVYDEEFGGARIEDNVAVRSDGAEVLSSVD